MSSLLLASKWMEKLPLICVILVALILLSIFISGMRKGLIGAGKGGIVWAIAGLGFVLAFKFTPNPLQLGDHGNAVWGMALIVAIVVLVLLLCIFFRSLFAPKRKKAARANDVELDDEREYELDDVIAGRYNDSAPQKTKYEIKRETSPGILARFLGGLTAIVNVAIILAIVAAAALLVVDVVTVDKTIAQIIGGQLGDLLAEYVIPHVFDFLAVCIILIVARRGFSVGTIGFTRILFLKVGILTVVIAGMAAPFLKAVNDLALISTLIDRFGLLFKNVEIIPNGLLAQIATGVLLAVVGAIVMVIINWILKKLMELIENTTVLRVIDGVLATVIYLAFGVALCCLLWSGLYLLDACGIFQVREILAEKTFSFECFKTAESFLKDFAEKYLLKFA